MSGCASSAVVGTMLTILMLLGAGPRVVAAATTVADTATDAGPRVLLDAPRAFGHHIGDHVVHRFTVDVPADYTLQRHSLPAIGNLNYWLELRELSIVEAEAPVAAQRRYVLTLTYQLFYAPLDVRELRIPSFPLAFTAAEKLLTVTAPSWTFTMSPIMQIVSRGVAQQGGDQVFSMPDERPQTIPTGDSWRRFAALGGVFALWLLWLAWHRRWWPGRSQAPFALALRAVRRLSEQGDATAYREALQRMHRAMDATHGQPLFAEQLAGFLEQRPQFQAQRAALGRFFERSRRVFFGGEMPASDLRTLFEELLHLLRDCRRCERSRR